MEPVITFTTDFGTRDGYTAQMKGVVLGICPGARLIDVTHDIRPYAILEGALVLNAVSRHFPEGTIHVGVVDPGVGGPRREMALNAGNRFYVGPDNGLFSFIFDSCQPWEARAISNSDYMLPDPHPTFHGRDVFSATAAHLCAGRPFDLVGPPIQDPVRLNLPQAFQSQDGIRGQIIYVDRFGNLTSNISAQMLTRKARSIEVGNLVIQGIRRFFGEVSEGEPLALINSFGFLEIAVNMRDASEVLDLRTGADVRLLW
ncbi:MAG: SAM-dependent chlorinase/fluorinase [Desulfomonile tiedjei]|uniref:SAM-dependent chlorinase/fluorinase n=1 Tax=Desulfomonile tiedjei TaxID=2358 RepID=A0A9D6Z4X5_9BACT|nr:SAM-dependent chlorinase/fluorinase [Desulfomonile tiedjei]